MMQGYKNIKLVQRVSVNPRGHHHVTLPNM